jgi:hypothetical protein
MKTIQLLLLLFSFNAHAQNICANPMFTENNTPDPCTNIVASAENNCGPAVSGGSASLLSTDVAMTATNTINKKLACCLNGWKSRAAFPGDYKLDCVQNWSQAQASVTTFDQLYTSAADPSGVNARYVPLDPSGTPLVGFYRTNGTRCNFTGNNTALLAAMDNALTTAAAVNAPGGTLPNFGNPAAPDPRCGLVLRAALKVICPSPEPTLNINAEQGRSITVGGVTRCRAAEFIRPVFDLRDVSNPGIVGRSRLPGFTMMEVALGNQNQPPLQVMQNPGFNYRAVLSRLFNFPPAATSDCTDTQFTGFITGPDQLCTLQQ